MLDHSANAGRHAIDVRKDDLYETPPEATLALLAAEQLPARIWEPACGHGAIVNLLREHGHVVHATDLVNHGCPDSESSIDFLMERAAPVGFDCIVTNPPYKLADEFAAHALQLVPQVYMLLRLAFLESQRRTPILENGYLARVHVFRNRLPMMHRNGWDGPIASSSVPFCWFCWDRINYGPTELRRISWMPTGALKGTHHGEYSELMKRT